MLYFNKKIISIYVLLKLLIMIILTINTFSDVAYKISDKIFIVKFDFVNCNFIPTLILFTFFAIAVQRFCISGEQFFNNLISDIPQIIPGMNMAIDADYQANLIIKKEVKQRSNELRRSTILSKRLFYFYRFLKIDIFIFYLNSFLPSWNFISKWFYINFKFFTQSFKIFSFYASNMG